MKYCTLLLIITMPAAFLFSNGQQNSSEAVTKGESQIERTTPADVLLPGKNEVEFGSNGDKLSGVIYLPDNFSYETKYPSIIVDGATSMVKEQASAEYAEKLVKQGYAVMIFDHKGFGSSGGDVRNLEYTPYTMVNIRDAISYFRMHDFVDRDHFFALGICAGGTRLSYQAVTDKRIKALATVVAWFDGESSIFGRIGENGENAEAVIKMLEAASESEQEYYETGEYESHLKMADFRPVNDQTPLIIRQSIDYYDIRSKETPYSNRQPEMMISVDPLFNFSSMADRLYMPFLVITGTESITYQMAQKTFAAAIEPKEYYEISGASHHDMYDLDKYTDQAAQKIDNFFKSYTD